MNKPLLTLKLMVLAWLCAANVQATIRYVKPGSASTAWQSQTNVYADLQAALTAAVSGDEIWVAGGTYKPTTGTDRTVSFNLKDGVSVYGGFAGTETLLTQRNWVVNPTILSGDIGVAGTDTDNSNNVVKGTGTAAAPLSTSTIFDGFIIEKGYGSSGSGMSLTYAPIGIGNTIFRNNYSSSEGGAVYVLNSNAIFGNIIFANNKSGWNAGAVSVQANISSNASNFYRCVFYNNTHEATYTGTLSSNTSATKVLNCIFYENTYANTTNENCHFFATGGTVANPLFVNPAEYDFRLAIQSPCIDKGKTTTAPGWITTDFYGNQLSIGTSYDIGIAEGGVNVPRITEPVANAVLAASTQQVTLKWDWLVLNPNSYDGYELEIKRNNGVSQFYSAAAQNYLLTGLTMGNVVNWRVRAKESGLLKNWSNWSTFAVPHASPIYVKVGGTGDGSSWAKAFGNLQTAIDNASFGDEIWVATGTYTPTTTTTRTISIGLKNGVAVYGGFNGTETKLSDRNWRQNPTILSGNIGNTTLATDNSSNILKSTGTFDQPQNELTRLDGFIVEQGYGSDGAGLLLKYSNMRVANTIFRNNFVSANGGAIKAQYSAAVFANTVFSNNKASIYGGAVYTETGLVFIHCDFINNRSESSGGAILTPYNSDQCKITNSIVWGNSAKDSNPQIYNAICTNSCIEGGYAGTGNVSTDPLLIDVTNGDYRLNSQSPCIDKGNNTHTPLWLTTDFYGNVRSTGTAVDMGVFEGGIITPTIKAPINNSIFPGTTTFVTTEWEWQPSQPVGITGYEIELQLNGGASVILPTSGTSLIISNIVPGSVYKWRVRGVDGAAIKNWSPWHTFTVKHNTPIYVKAGGTGNGLSWSNAVGTITSAINLAVTGDQIWVASGTYKPTTGTDRSIGFELKNAVSIYGGFAGTETDLAQRNWVKNQTILSGEIGNATLDTDNSYNVIKAIGTYSSPLDSTTRLDGVIIEKGYGNTDGGGVYLKYANIVFTNTIFRNNYTADDGGAVYAQLSKAVFANTLFLNNKSNDDGAAVFTESTLTFIHCAFINNRSEYYGGAVYCSGTSAKISNSIAWGNSAKHDYQQFYNATCTYSSIQGGYAGTGNIDQDPLFVDIANGDYRLNALSPCKDKGSNTETPTWLTTDFNGTARLIDPAVDMGIYEGGVVTPTIKTPANKAVLSANTTSTTLTWEWLPSQPAGITGYEIEVQLNGGASQLLTSTNTTLTISNIAPASSYKWRVRGIDGTTLKNWSPWALFSAKHATPLYVKTNGTGNGLSWSTAMGSVQAAIDAAVYGDSIWVAAGTYKPTSGTDRSISFKLKDGVTLYGGFVGNETRLKQRDWAKNPTILSGDIGTVGLDTDNSYIVVKALGTVLAKMDNTAGLDGFVVEKAYNISNGGGLYLEYSNAAITNSVFRNNYTDHNGAAVNAKNSASLFTNTLFANNTSENVGGAIYNESSITITHCAFIANKSNNSGGAIYSNNSSSSAVVSNSIVWGNTGWGSDSQFANVSCTYSCVQDGYTGTGNISSDPLFTDAATGDYRLITSSPCIDKGSNSLTPAWLTTDFNGNARLKGSSVDMGIYEGGVVTPTIKAPINNMVFAGTTTSTNLEWEWQPSQPAGITGYEIELQLNGGVSQFIAIGANTSYTLDAINQASTYKWRVRGIDGTTFKDWSPWATFAVKHATPLYVKTNGTGNGLSWSTAMGSVQAAIDAAVYGDSIWVAAGTYKPTSGTDRSVSFKLKDGVTLYGGFVGNETLLKQRDWAKNPTILSGDIGTVGLDTDNSYIVVKALGTALAKMDNTAGLDGFVIEKAYNISYGGGLYLEYANPVIANSVFRNNYTEGNGAAVSAKNSVSLFTNTLFANNTSANSGGAIYNESSITITHCVFIANKTNNLGGAIYSSSSSSPAIVSNSIVWGNTGWGSYSQFTNVSCSYSCVQGGNTGAGNISSDPLFTDAATGDCRLNTSSPCIDKGLNSLTPAWLTTDFNGNARLKGSSVDMGIYEGGVVTPTIKAPINNTVLEGTTTSTNLEWEWQPSQPAGIAGYEIELQMNGGVSQFIAIGASTSYTLDGINQVSTYKWRVRGIDGRTFKDWSPWATFAVRHATPLYVKIGGTGSGLSWATAMGSLQAAIDAALYGDEIWVAAGTYMPTTGNDMTISFNMKNGVAVYGGFDGTETQLNQRNWEANPTILSGDIGTAGYNNDNSYSVVKATGTSTAPFDNTTRLDGVIIEKGYAKYDGGGVYLYFASPTIANTIFRNNYASLDGGAVYATNKSSSLFTNTLFWANKANDDGGAVYSGGSLTFVNCTFVNNKAEDSGGAVADLATVTNCIAWGNSSKYGSQQFSNANCSYSCVQDGYSGTGNTSSDPLLMDVTIGDCRLNAASPCIDKGLNTIIPSWLTVDFANKTRLLGTNVDMGIYEGGVVTPTIKTPINNSVLAGITTSTNLEWEWQPSQPAGITGYEIELQLNGGASQFVTISTNTSYTLSGINPASAYKWRVRGIDGTMMKDWSPWSTFAVRHTGPIFVKTGGTGSGLSWSSALGSIQTAIDAAFSGDTIWVAAGTYKPTTSNDRSISFSLKNDVAIYGGFAGTETQLEQRDWSKNPTILSGDIGTVDTSTDNSYHVVKGIGNTTSPISNTSILDGFIIEKGYADGTSDNASVGAGIFLNYASPTIANSMVRNNFANSSGGGMLDYNSSAQFANVLFHNNKSNNNGGAVNSNSNSSFTNCTFANNTAANSGGAVYSNYTYNKIVNSIIWNNSGSTQLSNATCTYSCIKGGYTGTGNISNDPLFADAANGNFRLQQASPCINKGLATNTPSWLATDLDLLPRSINGGIDMGAYEAAYVASMTPGNNQAHTQSAYMGSKVKWDVDPTLSDVSKQQLTCLYELWKNGVPATIIDKGQNKGKAEVYINPVDFGTAYQWRVGVKTAGHTYWSTPATFYIGRENPIFVKTSGTGDGSSWANALGTVSSALELANPGDRIWVAAGTYKPSGTGRDAAFKLKPYVELLGGFLEDDNWGSGRNPEKNITILSGDLGTANDDADNAYHVINNTYTVGTPLTGAVIDGFTISGGNSDTNNGGGMLNVYANPVVRYCKFVGNKAASGGAIANTSSSPSITNSLLVKNSATAKGGAIFSDATSTPTIINNTIANNSAATGGGISGKGTVANTIVYANTGGQIEGTPTVTYSCVQGGFTGTGNITAAPRFKDADKNNYAIGPFSSCFDKGNSDLITSDFSTFDLSFSEMRNFVSSVDIGAYELKYPDIMARVEVTQATPANETTGINYSVPIVLTFNEPATILDPSGITMASGIAFKSMTLSDDKKTLTLVPTVNWPFTSAQKLVIVNGAIRFADNTNFRMLDYETGFDIRSCVPATVAIDLLNPATCPGTLATLTAQTTGDVQNYQWLFKQSVVASGTPSFSIRKLTADSTGVYNCNVTDMCGNTVSAQSEVKFVEGILKPVIVKKWNDVYLVDNSSKRFSDYQWYANDVARESGSQYITVSSPSSGQSLYVTVLDNNTGCKSTSDKMTISLTAKSVSVYPNPVVSNQAVEIQLSAVATDTKVRLYDASGNLKGEESIKGIDHYSFDKTNFAPGVYIMEIVEAEEKTIVKLIIQ